MQTVKIHTAVGYEQVWNSLSSLDPFPLTLFTPEGCRPSLSRLRTDILGSYRADWTYGRKSQWLIISTTSLDLMHSLIECEITDGHIGKIDRISFKFELNALEDGTEITVTYLPHFLPRTRLFPFFAKRRLRKTIENFDYNTELRKTSRFMAIRD